MISANYLHGPCTISIMVLGSVEFVYSMEVKCYFRVSRKVFRTFEIMVIGPGIDYNWWT